jgi:uncharacterized protein YjiK
MNAIKITCPILISICLFIGCIGNDRSRLPVVNVHEKDIADLNPLFLVDTTIKMSQIVDNIKVVALETIDEAMLSGSSILIGNKYILTNQRNEIYQFSCDGKFIRVIAKKGRGPEEIPSMGKNISYNINEELDLLYITCIDDIYLYILSTGAFLGKKNIPEFRELKEVRYITMTSSDSLFIYSYFSRGVKGDELCSGVAVQDWNGDVVWRKEFDYLTWTIVPPPIDIETLSGSDISVVNTNNPREFIFQVDNHDTCYIFNIDDLSLEPYLLRRTTGLTLKDGHPIGQFHTGSYVLYQEFNRINDIHLMRMNLTTKFIDLSEIETDTYYILYNDKTKSAYNVKKFEDDYFGFIHTYHGSSELRSYIYPSLAPPYGKFLIIYEASNFVRLANEELKDQDIPKEIKERILSLLSSVNETDNPLLLIGDLRKNIKYD